MINSVLITIEDMTKLLCELSKTHSETDAKTFFNELEIASDGSGWIIDLPTFMILMLHKGEYSKQNKNNKKKRKLKIFTKQWKYLLKNGKLISTENKIIQNKRSQNKDKIIKYPNYQTEYGIEFPINKCIYKPHQIDNYDDISNQSQTKVVFKDNQNTQQFKYYENQNINKWCCF